MAATRSPLNPRQVVVLTWISDGCPENVMEGSTHKSTAIALQSRGLVQVSRRGGVWRAQITRRGQHYLMHGAYPEPPASPATKTTSAPPISGRTEPPTSSPPRTTKRPSHAADPAGPSVQPPPPLSASAQLLADVIAAGGTLTVDRTVISETSLQRRIAWVNGHRLAPKGQQLTLKMAHYPSVTVSLVEGIPGVDIDARPVHVPERVARYHPVVVKFREDKDRVEISGPLLPRAARILHALVTEAERRAHHVTLTPARPGRYGSSAWSSSHDGHVQVTVSGHTYALRFFEEGLPARTVETNSLARREVPERRQRPPGDPDLRLRPQGTNPTLGRRQETSARTATLRSPARTDM